MPVPDPAEAVRSSRRHRLLRWVVFFALLLWVVVQGASLLLWKGAGRQALLRQLSAAFGRPVEVGNFDVSLLRGLRLEANGVTVSEDPRFGFEYFLRAERLTAGLRWTALLGGRLEFDSVSLTRPSLNLVRTGEGSWNLEAWLPVPGQAGGPGPTRAPASGPRLRQVAVDSGRINFKRGVDKHPFALVDVTGSFQQQSTGEWRLELEARPMRAGVVLQEAGVIRVQGRLGGTSARLRPADVQLRWEEAALSDALRMLRGRDYGVRGSLEMELSVRAPAPAPDELALGAPGPAWSFAGVARARGVHRWDLPPRAADPAFNVSVEADCWPLLARLEIRRGGIEGPATNIRASGFAQWGRAPAGYAAAEPRVSREPDGEIRLVSSGISLDDLFAWWRAFRPDVAPGASVEGNAGLDVEWRGWPLRVERVVMATDGARLRLPGMTDAPGLGPAVLRYQARRRRLELAPVLIQFGPPGAPPRGALRAQAQGAATSAEPWKLEWSLSGAARAQDLLAIASSLGIPPATAWTRAGWSVEGAADLRLRWRGTLFPFAAEPEGSLRLRGALVRAAFLRDPVQIGNATIELVGSQRRVTLQDVRAFGSAWSGTVRTQASEPWQVALAADAVNIADLHRGLSLREEPGLLQRLAPGRRPVPGAAASLGGLRARGQISVRQLQFESLLLSRLRGTLAVDVSPPWRVELSGAEADFYGGTVRGAFEVRGAEGAGAAGPAYRAEVRVRGANLSALTAGMPRLRGRFGGVASGELVLSASGLERRALLDSLAGEGTLEVRGAQATVLDLPSSLRAGAVHRGTSAFPLAAGRFAIAERRVRIGELLLVPQASSPAEWRGTGAVDGRGGGSIGLELRWLRETGARAVTARSTSPSALAAPREFRLTGTLDAPQLAPVGQGNAPR